jgi:hypothetical protein
MPAYDFNTGSIFNENIVSLDYIKSRHSYYALNTINNIIQDQEFYRMRAYIAVSSSYITWVSTGSVDTTGIFSGFPTSSLSDITVLPQFS